MALYGGSQSGRTGPYWRRQMGTTLPGEQTGPELAAMNAQRARLGLPPLGGPAQRQAIPAARPGPTFGQGINERTGQPDGGRVAIPEGPPPGIGAGGGGGSLSQVPLPQLLALRVMLANAANGRAPRQIGVAGPTRANAGLQDAYGAAQRSILPQLHQAVPVRSHVRVVGPRRAPIY